MFGMLRSRIANEKAVTARTKVTVQGIINMTAKALVRAELRSSVSVRS